MAEITVDFELECSECGAELDISKKATWVVGKINPCTCQEQEKDDLNNQIEHLKEIILEMKEELSTNNKSND